MIKNFICPDTTECNVKTCFDKCRMSRRCSPVSYLKMVSEEREWAGIPSVTQLLNGTRESYLKLKYDYSISPDSMAFAISGTKKHERLEDHGNNPELHMIYEGIQGTLDEIESDCLIDYKTSGSYKIAQCLGITTEKIPDGFYKNGKPKFRSEKIETVGDLGDWKLQVNMYRIMARETKGIEINSMKIFAIVRDGGTSIAKSRGIDRNIYMIDVPFMEDGTVLRYFFEKRDRLLEAMKSETVPPLCSDTESWDGRKCSGYCNVSKICSELNYNEH